MSKNKNLILIFTTLIIIIAILFFAIFLFSQSKYSLTSMYDWIFEKYGFSDEKLYYTYVTNYETSYLEASGALRVEIINLDSEPSCEARHLTKFEAHDIAELSHSIKKAKMQKSNTVSLDFNTEHICLRGANVILFPHVYYDQAKSESYTFDGYEEFYLKVKEILKIHTRKNLP